MDVTIKLELAMGHKLHQYQGNCAHLHGHNYNIECGFFASRLDDMGFVEDFGELKRHVKTALAPFDHTMVLNENDPIVSTLIKTPNRILTLSANPTAEHLANLWFALIHKHIPYLSRVRVWETSNCSAISYGLEDDPICIRGYYNV
jgi:6-pyruvoyltetrahydropterin/6-carboxytetrahydropterin synthase